MDPITLSVVTIYVADKFVSQFIKEQGYGHLKNFFFPQEKYKRRLTKVIDETINEFEKRYPNALSIEKSPFYYDQFIFEILNQHILFKNYSNDYIIEELKKRENIIIPDRNVLLNFYELFTSKVKSDKKIKKLFTEENYKNEIFAISDEIRKLLLINNIILDKVLSIEDATSHTNLLIEQLKNRFGKDVEIKEAYRLQGLEIYSKIANGSSRKKVVGDILTLFANKCWIALDGNISMGKTQLAVLIAEKFDKRYWIDLKGLDCKFILEAILEELSAYFQVKVTSLENIDELIEEVPEGSILILEDLAKLELAKKDKNQFIALINSLNNHKVKLLTTSNFTIPQNIRGCFKETLIEEKSTPYLEIDEVKEILISYGATEATAEVLKKLVRELAEGQPTIVNAICRYLIKNDWNLEDEQLKELFSGNYSSSLEDEIYDRVINTVSDGVSRDLLYRLKIIIGKIRDEEIHTVATVSPKINRPLEKVALLSGLWLQKAKANIYEISPLIKEIKTNYLSAPLTQAINYSLGNLILSKKRLDQFEANTAIVYFIKAKSYNKAGFVLSLVLEESFKNPDLFFNYGFNSFWISTKLPDEMDLFLKSVIRTQQIYILLKKNEKIDFLIGELQSTVNEALNLGINVTYACYLLSILLGDEEPVKANKYLVVALKHSDQLKGFQVEDFPKEDIPNFESIIWNNLLHIKSIADFKEWFNTFTELSHDQIQYSISGDLYNISALVFCSTIFNLEAEKGTPNWQDLLEIYNEIIEKILPFDLKILLAFCYKYQIRCLCSKMNETNNAIKLYKEKINTISENKVAIFVISDELGRQLFYNGKKDSAIPYLMEALEIAVPKVYIEKVDIYLALNEIFGEKDTKLAHQFISKAYDLQDKNEFIDEVFSAKVIGELAISNWQTSDKRNTFYIMQEGVEKILFSYKPLGEYQATIIRYGHVLNYFYHLTIGRPLPDIDGLPYSVPPRGFFTLPNNKILESDFYFEQRKFMLAYIMCQSFEFLNDWEASKKWAYLCFQLNEEYLLNPFSAILTGMNIYLILDGKYEEAVIKEIDILKSINLLNSDISLTKEISNKYLEDLIKNRPQTTFDSFDSLLFEYVINFIVIHVLINFINTNNNEIIEAFLVDLKNIKNYFDDAAAIAILETAFVYLIDDEKNDDNIQLLAREDIELATQIKVIIYLLASLKSSTQKALRLHLALISRLEMISKKVGVAAYDFIVVEFFKIFWNMKINRLKDDFQNYKHLITNGIPKYEKSNSSNKLKVLFRILCYHLNLTPEDNINSWLNNEE